MENFIFGLIAPFLDPKKGLDDAPDIYPGSSEPASDPTRALRAGLLRPDLVFVITFRDIVPRT